MVLFPCKRIELQSNMSHSRTQRTTEEVRYINKDLFPSRHCHPIQKHSGILSSSPSPPAGQGMPNLKSTKQSCFDRLLLVRAFLLPYLSYSRLPSLSPALDSFSGVVILKADVNFLKDIPEYQPF